MTLPKFIITLDGYFRLGMVNQHKHLLKPGDQCRRMAIELELTVTLDDDTIDNLSCQFPIAADYKFSHL